MAQAIGVNPRYLDKQAFERRRERFWHLNLLDKGLAITFGRTPTFHRAMVREIGLPKLGQVRPFRTHASSLGAPGVFGAHYMYQKILLSHLMDDIWQCIHGETRPNEESLRKVCEDLDTWHEESKSVCLSTMHFSSMTWKYTDSTKRNRFLRLQPWQRNHFATRTTQGP